MVDKQLKSFKDGAIKNTSTEDGSFANTGTAFFVLRSPGSPFNAGSAVDMRSSGRNLGLWDPKHGVCDWDSLALVRDQGPHQPLTDLWIKVAKIEVIYQRNAGLAGTWTAERFRFQAKAAGCSQRNLHRELHPFGLFKYSTPSNTLYSRKRRSFFPLFEYESC